MKHPYSTKLKQLIKLQIQKKAEKEWLSTKCRLSTMVQPLCPHEVWSSTYCVLIRSEKNLQCPAGHIFYRHHILFTEKLLKQLFTELSIFYQDHLFSCSTWKAQHFILLYVQYLPGFMRKENYSLHLFKTFYNIPKQLF